MIKLVILADDLTGALDTGVQFANAGIRTLVNSQVEANTDAEVLVVNLVTRHLSPDEAYVRVFDAAKRAFALGIMNVYKKTDSGLRGNVGAELQGLMDASGGRNIAFVPAFPKMNRIVKGGKLYIEGVPVSKSVFGMDLFEPVQYDAIADVIHAQTDAVVVNLRPDFDAATCPASNAILVFDALSEVHIADIARKLAALASPALTAGCAGFAKHLDQLIDFSVLPLDPVTLSPRILVASASISQINFAQINYAKRFGWQVFLIPPEIQLEEDAAKSSEAVALAAKLALALQSSGYAVLTAADTPATVDRVKHTADKKGLNQKSAGIRIARNTAAILSMAVEGIDGECTIVISGGDTLQASLERMGCISLRPILEIEPCVAYSVMNTQTGKIPVITKSGSFGTEDILVKLAKHAGQSDHQEETYA
jgi:uncharacterized protein YgbK (DUF1537 family)